MLVLSLQTGKRMKNMAGVVQLLSRNFSILDPVHTASVPRDQTIYGMVDIMSHVLEQYFHHGTNTELQDRYCESVLKQ